MFIAIEYGIHKSTPYVKILGTSTDRVKSVNDTYEALMLFTLDHPEFSTQLQDEGLGHYRMYNFDHLSHQETIAHWSENFAGMNVMYESFEDQRYPCFEVREL